MPEGRPLDYSHSRKDFGKVKTKNKNPRPKSHGSTGLKHGSPILGGEGRTPVPPSPVHSPGRAKGNR